MYDAYLNLRPIPHIGRNLGAALMGQGTAQRRCLQQARILTSVGTSEVYSNSNTNVLPAGNRIRRAETVAPNTAKEMESPICGRPRCQADVGGGKTHYPKPWYNDIHISYKLSYSQRYTVLVLRFFL